MILSAAANVTMGDNKNKQNNPFDASSRRSVANGVEGGGGGSKTSGESCKESGE